MRPSSHKVKPFAKTDIYADFESIQDLHETSDKYLKADQFFHTLRKHAYTIGDDRYRQLHEQALRGDIQGAKILLKHTLSEKFAS